MRAHREYVKCLSCLHMKKKRTKQKKNGKLKHHILPFSANHIPVHSSLIPVHFNIFRYNSSSFCLIPVSFRLVPAYSGTFRSVPVFSNAHIKPPLRQASVSPNFQPKISSGCLPFILTTVFLSAMTGVTSTEEQLKGTLTE